MYRQNMFLILMAESKKKKVYDLDKPLAPINARKLSTGGFSNIKNRFLELVRKKKAERLTIMFIPHNEHSIRNYHISNLTLTILVSAIVVILVISSFLIINHTSTVQEIVKFKITQKNAKIQFQKIREEIKAIADTFKEVRTSLNLLHSLSNGMGKKSSPFAQGGASIPPEQLQENFKDQELSEAEQIPKEIFQLSRILNDMKLSEKPLKAVKTFIERRSNIIQNSPTIWPVRGYVVNPFGLVLSSLEYKAIVNNGIDIAAHPGSKVVATAPGVIIQVTQNSNKLFKVKVRHNYGYTTVFNGLDRVVSTIEVNKTLTKGDAIGYLGRSSLNYESILHYEIHVGVDPQDPMPYLSYLQY